jgi:pyrimidine-nucleoside phosphorylase
MLDLSDLGDYVVDKHSSGGVGDKTTLVVLPLVAACGVPVAKMSGRGLGFSGGTLDKLEAIPGMNINLSEQQFRAQAQQIGLVLAGQTGDLAPADGKLYALRDVTATVPSIPLIASSIMSKKLAAGANGIVLDVKVGSGAFMTSLPDARRLAETMVEIGAAAGRDVVALLSDMDQPLGSAVGNALEVMEAVEALRGGGPADLREHSLEVAAHMLRLAGQGQRWQDQSETRTALAEKLDSGAALERFRTMVEAQNGDVTALDDFDRLPQAAIIEAVAADESGYVEQVAADSVARAAFELGAGRVEKGAPIDLAVGVRIHVKVGDHINKGDPIATIYSNDKRNLSASTGLLRQAVTYSSTPVTAPPLFYDVISTYDRRQ